MLKVYLNELRKIKRQKTIRMIMLVGVLMPTFSFLLCLHNGYRFRNLVGMNILLGNFLVAPFLFSLILVMLFSMEEQNPKNYTCDCHTEIRNSMVKNRGGIYLCVSIFGYKLPLYICRRHLFENVFFLSLKGIRGTFYYCNSCYLWDSAGIVNHYRISQKTSYCIDFGELFCAYRFPFCLAVDNA